MKITRKELLSKQYETIDIVLEFLTVDDGKAGTFLMHVFDRAKKVLVHEVFVTHQFSFYYTFFDALSEIPIEDEEKVELIREVAQFQDEWENTLKGVGLKKFELFTPDKLVEEWEDYDNWDADEDDDNDFNADEDDDNDFNADEDDDNDFNADEDDDNDFNDNDFVKNELHYTFNNGLEIKVAYGEDGFTVNVATEEPQTATFTTFENLLYGLAPVVQANIADKFEFALMISDLYCTFAHIPEVEELKDEIGEILMK